MYKFSFVIDENINIKLNDLLGRAEKVKIGENFITLYIIYNNESIVINLSCYIDVESRQVRLTGWGSCRDEAIIQKLFTELGIEVRIRKKKLSLLDFAKEIIEIYNSGVRGRESILNEIMRREGIDEVEINRYLSLLVDASKRRVVKDEIKRAVEIIS